MDRRTIIKQISIITGAAFVGAELFIQSGCKAENTLNTSFIFTPEQLALLDEIGDTILPQTAIPGAKAIGIAVFMQRMVADCYSPEHQKIMKEGVDSITIDFEKQYLTPFVQATSTQKEKFLNEINTAMVQYTKDKKEKDPDHYFLMIKQLTILGFFTSEVGATQSLRYMAVPGKYDGSYAYKKGDKAWAT